MEQDLGIKSQKYFFHVNFGHGEVKAAEKKDPKTQEQSKVKIESNYFLLKGETASWYHDSKTSEWKRTTMNFS